MPRLLVEIAGPSTRRREFLAAGDMKGWKIHELELDGGRAVSFSAQYRRCAKAACRECPHGPYAYAVIGSGSEKRRVYLGALPTGSPLAPDRPAPRRARGRRR